MPTRPLSLLRRSRVGGLSRIGRRLAGLSYLTAEDFLPQIDPGEAARLRDLAARSRGDAPAPILVFGVMPRSGTNFVRDIIALHPDVCAEPGRLYEFPLLHAARDAAAFMDDFLAYFPANAEVLGRLDILAMLSGAWLRELQGEAGDRRILLKSPHVQNLTLAPLLFPGAKMVLCLRDGRDVVESALRTFGSRTITRKTFGQLAEEWRLAAEAILTFQETGPNAHPDIMVLRYEDLVQDGEAAITRLLGHANLDMNSYDWAKVADLPVRGSSRAAAPDDMRWKPQPREKDFNPVRRWANWSRTRKARFARIAGKTLEAAGYERHA